MMNKYTYFQGQRSTFNRIFYCSRKSLGCKAKVKLNNEGIIVKVDAVHAHPPPKYLKSSTVNRKRSKLWNYFEDLGAPTVRCKLCGVVYSGNKARHLKHKHPEAHNRMKRLSEKSIEESNLKNDNENQGDSVGDYVTTVGENIEECNIIVIQATRGNENEVEEEEETQEDEFSETIKDLNESSKLSENEADKYIEKLSKGEHSKKPQGRVYTEGVQKRSKLWNFFNDLGESGIQCKLCGSLYNGSSKMARHMNHKHPEVLKKMKILTNTSSILDIEHLIADEKYLQSGGFNECVTTSEENTDTMDVGILQDLEDNYKLSENDEEIEILTENRSVILQDREKTEEDTTANDSSLDWVNKYANKIDSNILECDVCKQIIGTQKGITQSMARHLKLRHPYIYAKETSSELNSDDESKQPGSSKFNSDVERKQPTSSKLNSGNDSKVHARRYSSWIRKYITRLDRIAHRCNICARVIRMQPGINHNMKRHFKLKHNGIFENEQKKLSLININKI